MRNKRSYATILILLYSLAATATENAGIPDAPSTLLPANAALAVTIPRSSFVAGPPPAPEHSPVIDKQFLILSAISTATIFADSYTTTWIGNNYRARGQGSCTLEGGEPLLYGLHPTAARSYAVGAGMASGAIVESFLARKHLPSSMKWMWPAAFLYETSVSVHGFTTNLSRC